MSDIIHTKCLIVGISENRNRKVSGGGFYDVLHISLWFYFNKKNIFAFVAKIKK